MPARLDKCATLHYWLGPEWCPFPEWAHCFIRLGWSLQLNAVDQQRAVIAVCVPHRGFVASFAALGAVLSEPLPEPTPEDVKRHFTLLLNLPDPLQSPTALTYLHTGRKIHGSFAGTVTRGATQFVKVCVQAKTPYKSGGLTHFVKEADAINLQIEPGIQPALGRHATGSALVPHSEFVNHFYGQDELHLLHVAARCRVGIIGRINALREETTQIRCAVPAKHAMTEGVLNDILRIRKFISDTDIPRVAIYGTRRDTGPSTDDRNATRLVIFDGADSYTKWGHYFPSANMLVVLDRTEAMFQEGLSQVNTRYYQRSGECQWLAATRIPARLDSTGFLELCR
jgi:hypothetical protein